MADDFYWIWLNRDDGALRSAAALRPLLERLDGSFLPKPSTLEVPGARDAKVSGWLDAKIGKAVDAGKESVGLTGTGVSASLGLTDRRVSLSVFFRLGPEPQAVRALFVDLCALASPTYARAGLNNRGQEIHDRHYAARRRTFYASGLFWLNFFGREEEARQGGAALAENPHARAERVDGGLLLQVGESPLDALEPEGEARLVAATRAMPPLPPEPPAPTAPPAPPPAQEPEIITVGGVRGWLDPADHSFWVTKHVDPPRPLDKRTIRELASLPGKGSPPVKEVRVLFSTEEAAQVSKLALEAAGVRAFYVASEDGQAHPA